MRHYGSLNGEAFWQLAFKTYLDRGRHFHIADLAAYPLEGPIQPNESRVYKISIRILKKNSQYFNNPNPKTQQWLRVYAPYQVLVRASSNLSLSSIVFTEE